MQSKSIALVGLDVWHLRQNFQKLRPVTPVSTVFQTLPSRNVFKARRCEYIGDANALRPRDLGRSIVKILCHLDVDDHRKSPIRCKNSVAQPGKHFHAPLFVSVPQSAAFLPIGDGSDAIGVLNLFSMEKGFFRPEDTGRLQLLSALIAFIHTQSRHRIANTEAANRLGWALKSIRAELGRSQDEHACRGGFSRMALSQWERGRWPPSMGPIYQWCAAPGLVAEEDGPQVSFLDVTPQLIMLLRHNPNGLRNLSPERFEHAIAERIDRMGYDVQLTGATSQRDGGIDLIAIPKIKTVGSFLMAAQIKHHHTDRSTRRPEVDRMLAWKDSPFRVGVMVTNTSFSHDAKWLADQAGNKGFPRLRDFEDLKRWLRDQFDSEFEWREIPDVISLAPGVTVAVPNPA